MALKNPDVDEGQYRGLDEASAHFFRAIKHHYTRDTSVDAIDALTEVLGKAWKGRVIFNMMANNYQQVRDISMRLVSPEIYRSNDKNGTFMTSQKIPVIKEIRSITGMGLTEAKVTCETAEDRLVSFRVKERPEHIQQRDWDQMLFDSITLFREAGFEVSYT